MGQSNNRNILFIGHIFPELSYESIRNYFFCLELANHGNRLTLLSDSMIQLEKNGFFGNYEDIVLSDVFEEKYHVDPFQYRNIKENSHSIFSLLLKVLRRKSFSKCIISNPVDYGYLTAILPSNVGIEICILDDRNMIAIEDDYGGEEVKYAIEKAELVIMSNAMWLSRSRISFMNNKRIGIWHTCRRRHHNCEKCACVLVGKAQYENESWKTISVKKGVVDEIVYIGEPEGALSEGILVVPTLNDYYNFIESFESIMILNNENEEVVYSDIDFWLYQGKEVVLLKEVSAPWLMCERYHEYWKVRVNEDYSEML